MKEFLRENKYQFEEHIPEEVLAACKNILVEHSYMIPSWCDTVSIGWNPREDDDSIAYVNTYYEYRTAHITICPLFLDEDYSNRRMKLKHELCHIINAPLVNYFRNMLATVLEGKDNMVKELITEGTREKFESVTEDLACILTRFENLNK